jgi:hypothetical protein
VLIQLSFGQAVCQARRAFLESPTASILTRASCERFNTSFSLFQSGLQVALQHERYAIHVHNGAASLHTLALVFIEHKRFSFALPLLLYSIFALENCIPLMTTAHLSWRVTLYTTAAKAYENLHGCMFFIRMHCFTHWPADQSAVEVLQRCVKQIDDLQRIERVSGDMSAEASSLFGTLRSKVKLLAFRIAVLYGFSRNAADKRPAATEATGLFSVPFVRSFTEVGSLFMLLLFLTKSLETTLQGVPF